MDERRPLGKPTEFDRRAEPIVCLAAGGVPLLAGTAAAVTREQMAAFLRRLADSAGSADTAATAGHATTADSATNAASANMATTADSAAESELLAGREPGT